MKKTAGIGAGLALFTVLFPYAVTLILSGALKSDGTELLNSGRTVTVWTEYGSEVLDAEEYLIGVVAGQISDGYELEAIKAQAILTRTYLYKAMGDETSVDSSSLNLAYLGKNELKKQWSGDKYEQNFEKFRQAVDETKGMVMTYDGKLAEGMFHQVSSGMTRDGSQVYPYIATVESAADIQADGYLSLLEFTGEEFSKRAEALDGASGISDNVTASLQVVERDSGGYVLSVMIGALTYSGEAVQEAFSLPSCNFSFQAMDGGVRIVCKGIGHGYGMSQFGASKMAEEGKTAQEILCYYFQNVVIETQ